MFTGRIHSLKSLERSKLTGIAHLLRAIPSPTRCHGPAIWLALLVALCIAILPLAFTRAESPGAPAFSDADLEFFENKVRPLLVEHCYECHSANAETLEGGLRLDSRASILAGGDTQEAVVPGHPDQSLLIDAIEYGDLYEMPPDNKLPEATVAIFRDWVQRGAPWPEEELKNGPAVPELFDLQKRKSEHWAWQQLLDPPLPEVYDASWVVQPLDRFVLAKLEGSGIQPAPAAEPHTLLRRAYFDLIGLPPPREVVAAFEAEPTAEAFSAVIDQLLDSPQFGERWARHWLDLMRYAETRGHEHDHILPNAWQYRDYVIRAFNADVPYDQFVTEHLAGDLLDPPRMNPEKRFNESILATGFWYLGEWIHSPVDIRKDETDRFDNAIDVFGKTFLGLTVACARCHDHKFDAISQEDYYALAGFLQSSGYRQVRFDTLDHNRSVARQLQELRRSAGAQLAEQEALNRLASSHQMEALLLAATEAVAAGILPEQKNASVGRQVPIALVAANAPEEVHLRRLTDIASRRGLSVNTLMPWLAELIKASTNPQHPLHGLASAATNPPSQKAVELDKPEVEAWSLPKRSRVVVDFDNTDVAWLADGPAFGAGPLRRGEVLPSGDGMKAIAGIVDRGHARLSPQLADLQLAGGVEGDPRKFEDPREKDDWVERPGRVLRTPTVELRGGKLFYLVRGAAKVQVVIDSHRLLVGPLHFESIMTIDHSEEWGWVEHDLTPYVGHGVHVEFSPNGDWPLDIYMVVEGEEMPSLPLSNEALTVSAALPASDGAEKMARNYAALIVESLTRLAENNLSDSAAHRAVASWAIRQEQLWPSKRADAISTTLAEYRQQSSELMQKLLRQSSTAPAIWDGVSENERLLIRGNSRTPGQLVERRLLTAIASSNQPVIQDGSGRLELARRLFASDNPLPSRVMSNRIWHHLTGRGIVPSLDNFGVLGQEPTHPELLDHLASRFIDHRWSIKAMIREVMLSRTYQMLSRGSAAGDKLDPQNLLLHRMPVRRLQAEAIRDSMLSLAHRLDLQQFGPSVPIHLTDFMNGRGRPEESGPLDGAGRRSIYVSVRRNFLSPMMLAFDTPQPAGPVGRRNVSNVPAQALILLNDPFVLQQARLLAKHLIDAEPDDDRRIERMYVEAFARPPDDREAAAARQFLALQASQHEAIEEEDAQREAWADLCHVMFNLKEFIFLN